MPPRKKELLLDEETRRALGACLRALRTAAHLSQERAGERIGVSQTTLCHYETGKYEPSLRAIHQAAVTYNVHPNVILGIIYRQEFFFDGLDPGGYLSAEAAGVVRIQDALKPEERAMIRRRLVEVGYRPQGRRRS